MKKFLLVGLGALLVMVFLTPVGFSRVKDTPHKLHGQEGVTVPHEEVCRPCHAPHNTSVDVGYLWNHVLTGATYTLHEGVDQSDVSTTSKMCLSCHDGTVAIDAFGQQPGSVYLTGSENLGTDLRSSHPIGVEYPAQDTFHFNTPDADGNVADPDETPAGQAAHLEDGRVQCVSCHYAHGSRADYGMFLRVDNTRSALCMSCHKIPG